MHASFLQLAHHLILLTDACELLASGKAIRDSSTGFTASSSINSTIVSSEQRTPTLKALPCFLSSPGAQSREGPSDANSSVKQLLTPPITCASPRMQRAREGRSPLSRARCACVRACILRASVHPSACFCVVPLAAAVPKLRAGSPVLVCRLSLVTGKASPSPAEACSPYACVRMLARAHVCDEPCRRGHRQGLPTPQQHKHTPSH